MKTALAIIWTLAGSLHAQIPAVSLIQLIGDPSKYDGKMLKVEGVVNVGFENNGLYISKEHWKNHLCSFAIWIDLNAEFAKSRKWMNGRYVSLEGTFHAKERGHMGLYMGTLSEITGFTLREAMSPDEISRLQEQDKQENEIER